MSDSLDFVFKNCTHVIKTSPCNYITSFFNIIESMIYKTLPNEYEDVDKFELKRCTECMELIFIFSITWALGGNLNEKGRVVFNQFMTKKILEFNRMQHALE